MADLWNYAAQHERELVDWGWTTLWLAIVPVFVGLALGAPLGLLASSRRHAYRVIVSTANVVYTIPALVMFLLVPAILGTGILAPLNVAIALSVYTTSLLVRSVADGLASASPATVEAARAIGLAPREVLLRVKLPLALPVIAGGVRVATVANVSLVSVGSVIGTAQLGQLFVAGNNTGLLAPIWLGLLLFMTLAAALDVVIQLVTHALTPWKRVGQ